ncbi:MAG TPA: hypothetical protein VG796_09500 [Verrucomicrobiales bacterium]|nr:hypothetical protein [Verrucomicrobiales bacterium]
MNGFGLPGQGNPVLFQKVVQGIGTDRAERKKLRHFAIDVHLEIAAFITDQKFQLSPIPHTAFESVAGIKTHGTGIIHLTAVDTIHLFDNGLRILQRKAPQHFISVQKILPRQILWPGIPVAGFN